MATISFCRICLITGVKMELLEVRDIKRFIDTNGLPLLACYECATVVGKVNMLLNKYDIAQNILENILQTQDQITKEELKSIDRKSFMLQSNLEYCKQPLIISFDTKPDRDLTVQSKDHESKKGDAKEEKFSITKEFEEKSFIEISLNECESTAKLGVDTDMKEVTDSADSNVLKNQTLNIIDSGCNDVDLLQMLGNCDDSDDWNSLEKVDVIIEMLNDDVGKVMRKKRKTRVPKSPKKNKKAENKLHLLEYLFEITKLTRSEQIKEFSKRKESVYYLNNKYKCELCFRGFNHRTTYDTHVKLSHDPGIGPSKCPVCNIIKKNNANLNSHMYNYHKHLFKCKKCDFISTARATVDRHRMWHDGAVYNCRFCGESFDKKMSQLTHERIKHPSEYLCDLCGLPFISMHGIRAHKRMAHFDHKASTEEANPQLYCEDCKIQFATFDAWHTHLQHSIKHNSHKKTTDTATPQAWVPECRYCGLQCKDRQDLRAHHSAEHRDRLLAARSYIGRKTLHPATRQVQQYPTQCHYCDLVLTSKGQHYRHHKNLHFHKPYKQGDFVCDTCGKTFLSKGSLSIHIETKHSERGKRFECDYCHMKFVSKEYLSTHIQRHLYPTHLCSSCGKVFKAKASLRNHIRNAHGGPRPHQCRFCQKTFIMGSMLKVHVNEVHLRLAKKRIRTRKKAKS